MSEINFLSRDRSNFLTIHPFNLRSLFTFSMLFISVCLHSCLFVYVLYTHVQSPIYFFSRRDSTSRLEIERGVTISKLIKINIDSYHPCFFFFEEEEEDFSFSSPFFLADSPIAFFSIRVRIRQKFRTKVSSAEGRVNNRRDTSSSRRRSGFKVGEVSRLA